MANNDIGFKELYEVSLKATYPIEMGDRKIEVGETIAVFDKVQIANFEEKKNFISADGGYDNRARVWWEETKEIRITLAQGVFSKEHLSLMTNASLIKNNG
jgi:intein/homing endonuclease